MPRDLHQRHDLTPPAPGGGASLGSLTVGCGARVILDSLSISFPGRRATCIVGPGGSGKSTLLNTLASAGRVAPPLWARGVVSVPRKVALCPQRHPPASTLTDILAGPDRSAGAVDRAWTAVPDARDALLAVRDRPLAELPRELRRLAELTPVLASTAALLLLDEPDAGASPLTLDWMTTQLAETRNRHTVVVATHHLRLARAVADEVLLLLDGTVVEHAPVEAFFEHPATARAAAYVVMGS